MGVTTTDLVKDNARDDAYWMQQALKQAQLAFKAGEVPVGAVVVHQGRVIAAAHNAPISQNDPTAHAEVNALRQAAKVLGNYRLHGCTLYVTLEPCAMCAMAALHARVERVVYGVAEPKTGAAGSVLDLFSIKQLNHQTLVTKGVLEAQCAALLQQFFQQKRVQASQAKVPLREDALRTPESALAKLVVKEDLQKGCYTHTLPSLQGLRLHYHYLTSDPWGEGAVKRPLLLCLHDAQNYSEQFAEFAALALQQGVDLLLPDLIGFGRSDKPKKASWHTAVAHAAYLQELLHAVLSSESNRTEDLEQNLEQNVAPDIELNIELGENEYKYSKVTMIAPHPAASPLYGELLGELALLKLPAKVSLHKVVLVQQLPQLVAELQQQFYPDRGYSAATEVFKAFSVFNASAQGLPATVTVIECERLSLACLS